MNEAVGDIWSYLDKGHLIVVPTNLGWTKRGTNVMGAGIAQQAKERYPELPQVYGEMCQQMARYGPQIVFWDDLVLFPVKTLNKEQPHLSWRSQAVLGLVEASAIQLSRWTNPEEKVAVPLVGCGNGRLSEDVVVPILDTHLDDDRFLLVRRA